AIRAVDVAQDHLVLRVGKPPGLGEYLVDIRLRTGTVRVAVADPAAGRMPAASVRVEAERQQELVGRLGRVLAYPVQEALADRSLVLSPKRGSRSAPELPTRSR